MRVIGAFIVIDVCWIPAPNVPLVSNALFSKVWPSDAQMHKWKLCPMSFVWDMRDTQ